MQLSDVSQSYRLIPLTQGYAAIVDSEDYERLSRFKWQLRRKGASLYAQRRVKQTTLKMHSDILGTRNQIDHKNGYGLDNRKMNLRMAGRFGNNQNKTISKANHSGFKGVSRRKGAAKWLVHIKARGKNHYIGSFENREVAARAYDAAARRLHGCFARTNF